MAPTHRSVTVRGTTVFTNLPTVQIHTLLYFESGQIIDRTGKGKVTWGWIAGQSPNMESRMFNCITLLLSVWEIRSLYFPKCGRNLFWGQYFPNDDVCQVVVRFYVIWKKSYFASQFNMKSVFCKWTFNVWNITFYAISQENRRRPPMKILQSLVVLGFECNKSSLCANVNCLSRPIEALSTQGIYYPKRRGLGIPFTSTPIQVISE